MILRELFARFGLDVDAQSFAKGELAAGAAKLALEKLVETAKEAVHAFVENVEAVAEWAENIHAMAQATGLGTDSLQRLGKAAAMEGIGLEEFGRGMMLLSRQMVAAKGGSEEAQKAFKRVGTSVKDAHGKLRPTEDVFMDMAEGFAKLPDGAEKTALAMELLGRSGASMIPVLNQGREELEKFMQAKTYSEEELKAGKEVVVIQRQLAAQTKILWREAIAPLLPAIRDLLKQYLDWKKANAEVMKANIRAAVGYGIKAVKALASAFVVLLKVLGVVKTFIGFVVKGIAMIAKGWWELAKVVFDGKSAIVAALAVIVATGASSAASLLASWLMAAAPFILIGGLLAGIMLIFDDLRVYSRGGKSLFGLWKQTIDEWLKPKENDPWFVEAIKKFVGLIREAIELMHQLDEAANRYSAKNAYEKGGLSKGAMQSQTDKYTLETARKRAAMGLPVTDEAKRALERSGVTPEAFLEKYGPKTFNEVPASLDMTSRAAGGGGASVVAPQSNTIIVNPPPGSSPTDIAQSVDERLKNNWQSNLEDAAASIPGG